MSIKKTTLHPDGDFSVDLYPKTSYDQVDGIYSVYTTGDDQAIEYRFIPDSSKVETYINVDSQVWTDVISNAHIELDGDVAIKWGRWQDYNYINIANSETHEVVRIKSNGIISYEQERDLCEVPICDIQLKKNYRHIETITLTEDQTKVISRTTEPNGNNYNFSEVCMLIMPATGSNGNAYISNIGISMVTGVQTFSPSYILITQPTYTLSIVHMKIDGGISSVDSQSGAGEYNHFDGCSEFLLNDKIREVRIGINGTLAVGSKIIIYAKY